mgnify:CR=1 FL=1
MNLEFTPQAFEDLHWLARNEPRLLKRLVKLLDDVRRSPFEGLGKPEPLRGDLSGWWSRRIDGEHRLVYRVIGDADIRRVQIAQCRYHY